LIAVYVEAEEVHTWLGEVLASKVEHFKKKRFTL
jgi:hypothetical protein